MKFTTPTVASIAISASFLFAATNVDGANSNLANKILHEDLIGYSTNKVPFNLRRDSRILEEEESESEGEESPSDSESESEDSPSDSIDDQSGGKNGVDESKSESSDGSESIDDSSAEEQGDESDETMDEEPSTQFALLGNRIGSTNMEAGMVDGSGADEAEDESESGDEDESKSGDEAESESGDEDESESSEDNTDEEQADRLDGSPNEEPLTQLVLLENRSGATNVSGNGLASACLGVLVMGVVHLI